MKLLSLSFSLLFLSTALYAQTLCTFTQECLEGEPCADTQFDMTLAPKAGTDGQWTMTTDAETLDGNGYAAGSLSHLMFIGESAGHLVTITDAFEARYSTHMDGPFSITYHGTCEGLS